jgi:hypothetical protein
LLGLQRGPTENHIRPRDDHLAYELRLHQHNFLRDYPAHREPEEVHPFETHDLDERDCVLGHLLYRGRRCVAGRANASIVERDQVMLRRETINNPRFCDVLMLLSRRGER